MGDRERWSLTAVGSSNLVPDCDAPGGPVYLGPIEVRSDAQQTVGHGGGLTGVKNCRCELCGPLKNRYMRDLRARRKMGD